MMRPLVMTILSAGLVLACDPGPTDLPDLTVERVDVSPDGPLVLVVGDTVRLTAYPKTADGTGLGSLQVDWSSDSAQVASLSADGYVAVLRAVAPGTTVVHATAAGRTGSLTVIVQEPPVATVAVSPDTVELEVGDQAQLGAELRAADGTILQGRAVTWSSAADHIATVDATGKVTAHAGGVVAIRAESEGVRGEAVVLASASEPEPVGFVVVGPGSVRLWIDQQVRLEARVLDSSGLPLAGRAVAWSIEDAAVATVDSTGSVRASNAGTTRVRATSEGVSGVARVETFHRPVDGMELTFAGTLSDTASTQVGWSVHTTWVDSLGEEHPAFTVVKEGRLSMGWSGSEGTYEQVLVFATYITESHQAALVSETEYVDRGTLELWYDMFTGEPLYRFTSSTASSLMYGARFSLPGELAVEQPAGAIPLRSYYFRLEQP